MTSNIALVDDDYSFDTVGLSPSEAEWRSFRSWTGYSETQEIQRDLLILLKQALRCKPQDVRENIKRVFDSAREMHQDWLYDNALKSNLSQSDKALITEIYAPYQAASGF